MQNLMKVFTMAEPTKVTPEKCVSFCGYEIGMDANFNYTISQEKYVEELINKYKLEGVEPQPIPKVIEGEDESPISTRSLKAAQTIAGELLWVMTRSRPDICFAISLMTRLLHRRPSYVVELGKHVVKYLAGSKSMGLKFGSGMEGSQELFIKTDTSFAPPLEAYRSIQGTAIFHGEHLSTMVERQTVIRDFKHGRSRTSRIRGWFSTRTIHGWTSLHLWLQHPQTASR